MNNQMIADLGAKLSADITEAFKLTPSLGDNPEEAFKIACFGLTAAFGATIALACVATGDASDKARKRAARELADVCQRALT